MCHTPLLVHLLMQEDFQTVSEYVRRRETLHKFEGQLLHTHMIAQRPNNTHYPLTAHRSTTPAASTHSLPTHCPQEYYTCSINTLTTHTLPTGVLHLQHQHTHYPHTTHRSTTPAASTHSLSTHYPQEYYTCSINTIHSLPLLVLLPLSAARTYCTAHCSGQMRPTHIHILVA